MKIDMTRDCCLEVMAFDTAADDLCGFLGVCSPGPEEIAVIIMALNRCREKLVGAIDETRRGEERFPKSPKYARKFLEDLNRPCDLP